MNSLFSPAIVAALVIVAAASAPASHAQDTAGSGDSVIQRPRPAGIRRFRPGRWGIAGVEVVNRRDTPTEVVSGLYVDGDSMSQFSRRIRVPAGSRRTTWIPLHVPEDAPADIQIRRFLRSDAEGVRALIRSADETLFEAETLTVVKPPITVIVDDWHTDDEASLEKTKELAVTMRLSGRYTRVVTEVDADDIPAFSEGLDAVDHIVLAGNQIADSPTGLATIRAWLHNGGRLWILLDQVDLRTVDLLLGDAVEIAEVDRVRLTDVQFQNVLKNQPSGELQSHDDPVEFVRVVAPNVEVTHEVDGWPAAFRQHVGHGRIMFTTLSAYAWMRPRRADEWVADMERNGTFIAVQALDEVTDYLTRPLAPEPLSPEDFEPLLSSHIGYHIPHRAAVLTILAAFWAGLLFAGFRLLRSARLERLAIAGPMMALVAAAPLVFLGQRARSAVPPAVATAEFACVGPGSDSVHSLGMAAMFFPEPTDVDSTADDGRLLSLRREKLEGSVRQTMWTDLDRWQWNNLTLPSGLHFAATRQHRNLTTPLRATAAFGPDGIRGTLQSGPYSDPTDVVIATTTQHALAVHSDQHGGFSAGADDLREPGTYLVGGLLSDERRQHQAIYRKLLLPGLDWKYPDRPMLLAWTRPSDSGLTFADGIERSQSALLAIPLELQPTPPGTDVFIPSPFLPFETVATADGTKSTAFDDRTGQWQKTSYPTVTMLRFALPPTVLPLNLNGGKLFFSIRAPQRTVTLSSGSATDPMVLRSLNSPVGSYELEIDSEDALRISEDGALHVQLDVSELQLQESEDIDLQEIDRSWTLDYIRLELHGSLLDH
ncbi:MAG: hypothetical protein R3C19_03315 [Planctomycetaceae bacterium]